MSPTLQSLDLRLLALERESSGEVQEPIETLGNAGPAGVPVKALGPSRLRGLAVMLDRGQAQLTGPSIDDEGEVGYVARLTPAFASQLAVARASGPASDLARGKAFARSQRRREFERANPNERQLDSRLLAAAVALGITPRQLVTDYEHILSRDALRCRLDCGAEAPLGKASNLKHAAGCVALEPLVDLVGQ